MGRPAKRATGPKKPIVEVYCIRCNRMLSVDQFYKSVNPLHTSGYLPYCKSCGHEIVQFYIKKYNTLQMAIYLACAEMGVPFIKSVYDQFEEMCNGYNKVRNFFGNYVRLLRTNQTKAQEERWKDFGGTDMDMKEIRNSVKSMVSIEAQLQELEIAWGTQYNSEQLAYLEYKFTTYTDSLSMTPFQETTYRNLCKAELDIYENNDLDNAIKRQTQFAKLLGIDAFDKQQQRSLTERILEAEIELVEQKEPAEYFEDKGLYNDFRGLKRSYILELLRPLKNLITGSKEYNVDAENMGYFEEELVQAQKMETEPIELPPDKEMEEEG